MKNAAIHILKQLRNHGYETYFVGGCVRDMLLKRPIKDFDLATSAKTQDIQNIFSNQQSKEKKYQTILVGKQFGVLRVRYQEFEFEIATFRKDGEYKDGRHPENVTFSTAKADVLRRDFTVNGLLYDPLAEKILDYVEGQQDLRDRKLRTIGAPPLRFTEDKLRLLRAIRFACQLDFRLEAKTWETLCQMASQIMVVSRERIQEELSNIFASPNPLFGVQLMAQSGLLKTIFGAFCPNEHQFQRSVQILSFLHKKTPALVWSALLCHHHRQVTFSSLKKSALYLFLHHLKCANTMCEEVATLIFRLPEFEHFSEKSLAQKKRFIRQPYFFRAFELYQAALLADGKPTTAVEELKSEAKVLQPNLHPTPLITGDTLIEMGFQPGKQFKEILFQAEEAQLNEEIHSEKEARWWLSRKNYFP